MGKRDDTAMEFELLMSRMAGDAVSAELGSTLRELQEAERWADGVLAAENAVKAARAQGRRMQAARVSNPVRKNALDDYAELLASGKTEREARDTVRARAVVLGKYGQMPPKGDKKGENPTTKTVNDWLRQAKNTHPT